MRKYSRHILTELGLFLLITVCLLPDVAVQQGSLESEGADIPVGATTLAFVFDVTGSMNEDLVQVMTRRILETTLQRRDTSPLYNFALVPFGDPEIGPITITNIPDLFQRQLQNLYVHGGGDCPELSVGAIYEALKISLPGSFIYVFTDASAKDYELTNSVLELIQETRSQVVFVLTGTCGYLSDPGFKAYEQIAATSSGQLFLLNSKSDVEEVLQFVEVSVQEKKVKLLSSDIEEGRNHSYHVPIDSRISYVVISVCGDDPRIVLRDPHDPARIITTEDGLEVLLALDKVYIVGIPYPELGVWHLQIGSTGRHTLRITAKSQLDFSYGFSKKQTWNLDETMRRPIKGIPNQLLIEAHKLLHPGSFSSAAFLNLRGEVIARYQLNLYDGHRRLYIVQDVVPPEEFFRIQVTGVDYINNLFHRISPAAISSLLPEPPSIWMPPRTPGYYGRTTMLTCEVSSLIPFTLQWVKDGSLLSNELYYNDSTDAIWDLGNVSDHLEGVYTCIAYNSEGSNRADTWLDVTEPPPTIKKPNDVTVFPNGTAILSCFANSTVPFNWTWDRPDSYQALGRQNRVNQLGNGSLEIVNVQESDAGMYRCIAMNEGGPSHQFVNLFVLQIPVVSTCTANITFNSGQDITLRCSATGYPSPKIVWTKDGRNVPPSPRTLIQDNGEQLFILGATDENEGIYTCTAINSAGTDWIQMTVSYIDEMTVN